MRDLVLLALIATGSLCALWRPWIGVLMWTWVSLMNPHEQFAWSAANWPVAMVVALCTLVGMFFSSDRQNPLMGAPVWALLAFCAWICITLPFSIYLSESLPLWERSMKIFLMIFVTLALLNTRHKLEWFVWVAVASLGFYGVKGGIFTLVTGGNFRIWGPGGFIGGNNEVALALVMTIPLMRYLQMQAHRRWVRLGLGAAMVLTAIAALGSYSRGALLALLAMAAFMWMQSARKPIWALIMVVVALAILPLMPDAWWERMDSIGSYQQDASSMGRINAWHMAWRLALDRFFGGGFMIYTDAVFRTYAPVANDLHAAHSIYFQVLGEHGFVGLILFLTIGISTWKTASRLKQRGAGRAGQEWAVDLGTMVQVGMVGYAVGGAFLSLAYFDLPYDMMAAVVAAERLVRSAGAMVEKSAMGASQESGGGVRVA